MIEINSPSVTVIVSKRAASRAVGKENSIRTPTFFRLEKAIIKTINTVLGEFVENECRYFDLFHAHVRKIMLKKYEKSFYLYYPIMKT